MEAWWWTLSIWVFLVAGVLLRYLGVLRMLIMGMPSTAGVRWRWGARVGPCRGATSYYGPVSSLHAQAAMLMTPRAVHSLPLRSARFDPIILPSFSLSLFLSHSLFLSYTHIHTHAHTHSLSLVFRHSYFFFLFLFLFSFDNEPRYRSTFSLSVGFVFVVETGGHDGKEKVNLADRFCPTSHTFLAPSFETCTPHVNSFDFGY